MPFEPTLRREYDPAALLAAHPPKLKHPHKQLAFEIACPLGATHSGPLLISRWPAKAPPSTVELAATELELRPAVYDYRGSDAGVWHVNFADPQLFVAYGSGLLAQDELQAIEHPLLGCVREALLAEKLATTTEDDSGPTPVLLANVERRCELNTTPELEAGRVHGLYGHRFATASSDAVRAALRLVHPPGISHLIAIAAPTGRHRRGPYCRADLDRILLIAHSGFSAALAESARLWPGAPVEVRSGFWGCGAFGGNRQVMTMLQLLAARICGVSRLVLYTVDEEGEVAARGGIAALEQCLAGGEAGEPLDALMERIADLDYTWGVSDGN